MAKSRKASRSVAQPTAAPAAQSAPQQPAPPESMPASQPAPAHPLRLLSWETLLALLAFALAAVVMFYPAMPINKLGDAIPYGDARQFTLFFAWAREILHSGQFSRFFDLPISHPIPTAGGLTDMLPGLGVLAALLGIFTSNPFLIHNLILLICGTLNGLAAYLLARDHRALRPAALFGGFVFAFSGLMQWHVIGHASVLSIFWTPLLLLALGRFLRADQGAGWGLLSGLLLGAQTITSSRLGIIALFAMLAYGAGHGLRPWRGRPWWRAPLLLGSSGAAVALVSWLYAPALRVREYITGDRELFHVAVASADLLGYFVPNQLPERTESWPGALLARIGRFPERDENHVYLGWSLYLVVLAGVVLLWRARRRPTASSTSTPTRSLLPFWVLAIVGFLVSLGPFLWFGGQMYRIPLPWYGVVEAIPALITFRAVARFSLLTSLGLSVMAALLLTRILLSLRGTGFPPVNGSPAGSADDHGRDARATGTANLSSESSWLLWAVCALLTLGAGLDFFVRSPVPRYRPGDAAIQRYLLGRTDHPAVINLPVPGDEAWLLDMIPSFPPTVNSIQGGLDNTWITKVAGRLANFPDEPSIEFLRRLGVSVVIDRENRYERALEAHPAFRRAEPRIWELSGAAPVAEVRQNPPLGELPEPRLFSGPPDFKPADPKPLARFEFNRGAEGWYLGEMQELPGPAGQLTARATGIDPLMVRKLNPPIDTRQAGTVAIRLRVHDSLWKHVPIGLYWRPQGGTYSEKKNISIRLKEAEEWQVIRFPLAEIEEWTNSGLVDELRLDPENNGLPGTRFEIDEIRIEPR